MDHQDKYCLTDDHVHCPFYAPHRFAPQTMEVAQMQPQSMQIIPFQPESINLLPSGQIQLPASSTKTGSGFHLAGWVSKAIFALLGLLLLGLLIAFVPSLVNFRRSTRATNLTTQTGVVVNRVEIASPTATVIAASANITVTTIQAALILRPTTTPTATAILDRYVTPTPEPGGQVLYLSPDAGAAGWWVSSEPRRAYLGDSYLYAGVSNGDTRISAMRFNLSGVPRGTAIEQVELRLTGLRADGLTAKSKGAWLIQLIAESALKTLGGTDFLTMYSAPASITLQPQLEPTDLGVDKTNSWLLNENARQWLVKQILDGAKSITVRILPANDGTNALFAWDSGLGPETKGNAPGLIISLGPPPPATPPLPTRPVLVATLTTLPNNVVTVVAQDQAATAVALTTGTYTPIPLDIVTPTPFPENLETVQAVAIAQGMPAVAIQTPTPANAAIATGNAEFATAVALTTGTFTPVPTGYVTPFLIYPSPPAENLATEAARIIQATAAAATSVVTPTLPFNAVIAKYVYATVAPENQATAVAQSVIATAFAKVNGTPTPLPWGVAVITAVPTPGVATATPLPPIQSVKDFTPTPTATAQAEIPDHIPDYYHNKVLFKTNRSGTEEIYALDPATGELYRVNEAWIYPMAQKQLGLSANGKQEALVKKVSTVEKTLTGKEVNESFQIFTHSLEYGTTKQITTYRGISYDPTWSPRGDLIAFVSTNSGNDEIYTVTPDGSVLKQLTFNRFEWDKHPTWKPDGTQIMFMSNRESGRRQLWLMKADGADQHNVSNNEFEDWDPIWVP